MHCNTPSRMHNPSPTLQVSLEGEELSRFLTENRQNRLIYIGFVHLWN